MSRHASARLTDCNLQSQLYCAVTPFQQNFSKFKICIRHIHNYTEYNQQLNVIGQLPTASSVLLMVSRIIYLFIYLNKCNRLDIVIFRL